ncbi:hypothetical protein QET91_004386 [Salmonella enterica]|nr:hypothetical protein [Salmonella enterica]EKT6236687.1 hypothetical protein [Salmonella enterica]
MITKEQATYLMKLVHDIDDASAAMALTANGAHEEHMAACEQWDLSYAELRTFVTSITESSL